MCRRICSTIRPTIADRRTRAAGTAITPPQLDEFMMPSEAHLRSHEMAALGWRERAVYG